MNKTPPEGSSKPEASGPEKGRAREAELISFPRRRAAGASQVPSTEHLAANRSLVVRRSLLATAVGGVVPIPVMDDYLAGRVRAGMLMQIADRRRVDLAPSSAELLADPREGTAARNATMTAATFLALKLAWRKFFLIIGAGRRAEEMVTTFQVGTLFDHFCARMHLGAGIDRDVAIRIRAAAFASIRESERAVLVGTFQDGGRVLGRTLSEAPAWASRQLRRLVEQYVASGGNPDAVPIETARQTKQTPLTENQDARSEGLEPAVDPEARWLDRAAGLVEGRMSRMGNHYVESLISRFEHHFAKAGGAAASAGGSAAGNAAGSATPAGGAQEDGPPPGATGDEKDDKSKAPGEAPKNPTG